MGDVGNVNLPKRNADRISVTFCAEEIGVGHVVFGGDRRTMKDIVRRQIDSCPPN